MAPQLIGPLVGLMGLSVNRHSLQMDNRSLPESARVGTICVDAIGELPGISPECACCLPRQAKLGGRLLCIRSKAIN